MLRHITTKNLPENLQQEGVYGLIAGNHVAGPDMIVPAAKV